MSKREAAVAALASARAGGGGHHLALEPSFEGPPILWGQKGPIFAQNKRGHLNF